MFKSIMAVLTTASNRHGKGTSGTAFGVMKAYWMHLITLCSIFFAIGYNFNTSRQLTVLHTEESHSASHHSILMQQQLNPLGIPYGKAINLPSIRTDASDSHVDKARNIYGGAGDKQHLGGFTELDLHGVSPAVWKHMLQVYGIHSVLDVGCGRGTSTSWFALHGCAPVLCVEGSHDAVEKSIFGSIQPESIVEHDFSRGPWWPEETFDAAWAVEFLEHVGVNFHYNYVTALRKTAIIFVSSSRWGGWHHVEVHTDEWWIRKYESYGLRYDDKLTQEVRAIAKAETNWPDTDNRTVAPNGEKYFAQHIWLSMKVFINPVVAALPQHAHLFPEHGCFQAANSDGVTRRPCGTDPDSLESTLPQSYWPLEPTVEQDKAWNDLIRQHITVTK
jgi:SAM-dependent methyltransferase